MRGFWKRFRGWDRSASLDCCPSLLAAYRLLPPYRFRRRQQFWKYCGLGMVMRSSSDWVQAPDGRWIWAPVQQTRGLNRRHNRVLKDIFKGVAMTVIARAPKDPLYYDYQRTVEAGTKPNLARLTLARRIAATALAIWKKEERYSPDKRHKPDTTGRKA